MENLRIINFNNRKREKQKNGNNLAITTYSVDEIIQDELNARILKQLPVTSKGKLIEKIHKNNLGFNDTFLAACYILSATNNLLYQRFKHPIEKASGRTSINDGREYSSTRAAHVGTEMLVSLREKELYVGLNSEEIAGLVAGSMMDLLYRIDSDEVTDTCGMGGDIGFDGVKTLNASTLSAIVNASLGIKVMKHGSYANTSPIGSTDFIEQTGANICMNQISDYSECLEKVNFLYTDAHEAKTIHDISHLLMGETINHIIGPMTTPVSRSTKLNRVIGVNHNVSTESIAKAYEILRLMEFQNVSNVCAIAGLSEDFDNNSEQNLSEHARSFTVLDELTPFSSAVSFVKDGKFAGTYLISPSDFGLAITLDNILASSTRAECYKENLLALKGNSPKTEYLAMNAALVYFTVKYLSKPDSIINGKINGAYLKQAFRKCFEAISSGAAFGKLEEYVSRTGGQINIGGI